jgi:hypothetical protein
MTASDGKTVPVKSQRPAGASSAAAPPLVIEEVRTKKKKRRYTSGLVTVQNVERGATRSLERVSAGVARMFRVYSERREDSSRKKRDGALRDALENWTKAMSKGMRTASKAPNDFVKAANRGRGSKRLRKTVRAFIPPPLR